MLQRHFSINPSINLYLSSTLQQHMEEQSALQKIVTQLKPKQLEYKDNKKMQTSYKILKSKVGMHDNIHAQ